MSSLDWIALTRGYYKNNDDLLRKIKIMGHVTTEAFQKARICALKLHKHLPGKFAKPEIHEMFQIAWHNEIEIIRRCAGGKLWNLKRPVVVFIDNELIGSDTDFIRLIGETYAFSLPIQTEFYENLIAEQYKQFFDNTRRKYVYFTFVIDDEVIGSFLIMLYTDLVPCTCEHFLKLCTGFESKNVYGTRIHYRGTKIHRIVKNRWLQIGDILGLNENSKAEILNEMTIYDESYCIPHNRRGVISMAKDGEHNNRDQFVVSLKPNDWMNCRYVAFGQLVDGENTLKIIENIPTYYESPTKEILVSECGEYSFDCGKKLPIEQKDGEFEEILGEEQPKVRQDHFLMDAFDERDVASIMMAERYEKGLYSLSTDNVIDSPEKRNSSQVFSIEDKTKTPNT